MGLFAGLGVYILLEFRFGFLCAATGDEPVATDGPWALVQKSWTKYTVRDFSIWADPLLPIVRRASEEQDVIVLGDHFSMDCRPVSVIVDELLTADPWPALDALGGRFAVLVISSGRCRVAHDAFGSRSVFYLAGNSFAVSSHSALLACAYGVAREEQIAAFMRFAEFRNRTVRYLPGDMTIYRNIYALVPNNCLDSIGNKTWRYWPALEMQRRSLNEFQAATDEYFAAFVPYVASRYQPIFGITGGADSRAVYCAFRRFGVPFRGVTWGGSYLPPAEEPIVQAIVDRLQLDHAHIDPRDYPSQKLAKAASINGGLFRGPSKLTEAMGAVFAHETKAAFIRGYGGEIIRGFYNRGANPMQDLQPETLVSAFGSSIRRVKPGREYKAMCAGFFSAFRKRGNYEGLESFQYDPNDIFYWEHRMGMWGSAMLNEMDPAVYSLVGFNSRPLYVTAFSLKAKYRLNKKLLRDAISRNDKELGSIPYG